MSLYGRLVALRQTFVRRCHCVPGLRGGRGKTTRKGWRPATMARLPKRATAHLEKGRELLKEAKSLK
jgi:hypothetical protein